MKRPRYSLRTFFVIITAIALFLGWQEAIIEKRQRLCKLLEQQVGQRYKPYNTLPSAHSNANFDLEYTLSDFDIRDVGNPEDLKTIPWYRRVMGDQPRYLICLPPEMTQAEEEEFIRAFPEADVRRYPRKNEISDDSGLLKVFPGGEIWLRDFLGRLRSFWATHRF